jgi:hypothetical protein
MNEGTATESGTEGHFRLNSFFREYSQDPMSGKGGGFHSLLFLGGAGIIPESPAGGYGDHYCNAAG